MIKPFSLLKALLLGASLTLASFSQATVVTFDDVNSIPAGYNGLNWGNFLTLNGNGYYGGYQNAFVSGTRVAYNASANDASVSGSVFDFNGAFLTAAWNDNLNIQVTGSLAGNTLFTKTVIASTQSSQWFSFNFTGIDTLSFHSFGGTPNAIYAANGWGQHFAMDNFTFNQSTKVPEPSALLLLGLGLLGLAGARVLSKRK